MPAPIKGLPHVGDSWRNTETDESGTVVGYAPDVPYMGEDGKLYPTTSPVVKYDSGETLFGVTPQYTLPEVTATGHLKTPADDLDKVMLGTLAAGVAPMALPEIVSGATTALANPYVDAALTSMGGAHAYDSIKNGTANAMTALELMPFVLRGGTALANTLQKALKYNRLEKNYVGVPHKAVIDKETGASVLDANGNPVYMDESFPITYNQHTIWTANDSGYPRFFAHVNENSDSGKIFDVYTDPKALKIMDTPNPGEDYHFKWSGLPFKLQDGKVKLSSSLNTEARNGIYTNQEEALKGLKESWAPEFTTGKKSTEISGPYEAEAKYINESPSNIYIKNSPRVKSLLTDGVVQYSKDYGYDATRFHRIYDGGLDVETAPGRYSVTDYPIDELILNPGSEKFILPHGTSKYNIWKQLPSKFTQPTEPLGNTTIVPSLYNSTNSDIHAYGGSLHKRWNDLSIKEKRDMMKVAISNGITNLSDIKDKYNEFAMGGDTVEEWVDAIYSNNPKEEFLGEPSHHYDFTQTDEWADAHGYYPDARGHRDDRVKKPAHPSHPSRGTWDGDKFILSDLGMQNPNYTLFGLNDGSQDPQAILTYRGGSIIPEITATPKGNYIENPYDNTKLHFAKGGNLYSGGGYVYDILPQLFAMDGVPVTVTSGYRPGAVVAGTNRLSRHARHEAVDLRGDFAKMQQVLNNPNSNVARWMLANGYGYLNEAPTFGGTTKYWPKKYFKPDGTPDFHDHFHIGKDFGSKYAASFRGVPQQQQPRAMYTGMGWRNIAADNIMRHEGFMQHSYADAPKGKSWRSIGYGFNDSGFYNKYPMGISKYYDARGGITRAEAQQELNYMLDNMERQARAAYGSRWDQFNDNQKAAIMDTMYQRPASVLKGSQFHRAVMAGDPNAVNYLGVSGFDKRNADRRGLFGSPNQYAMQMPMQQPMQQMDQFAGWEPSNPQAFYGQGNSAIDREMAEKMTNMEATMKAYQEAQEQQQLAAARQAERQEKAARANLAWNFVMGMNGDNQQQSPYMGLLGALSSNAIMGEE